MLRYQLISNGLSPVSRQAINLTNANLLTIQHSSITLAKIESKYDFLTKKNEFENVIDVQNIAH